MDSPETENTINPSTTKASAQSPTLQVNAFPTISPSETSTTSATTAAASAAFSSKSPAVQVFTFVLAHLVILFLSIIRSVVICFGLS